MIDDMFKLTIDQVFTFQRNENSEIYSHPNYDINENIWEEIYDLKQNTFKNVMKENCLTSVLFK